jgi:peptidoglycan/xylan/chitin deacetylase (PgdA/CDA1 family)
MLIFQVGLAQQRSVSITIDDVPNVHLFQSDGYVSKLLQRLDSLKLPVAIFINERNLQLTDPYDRNRELLRSWLLKDFVTAGNHSYSHPNYGEVGFDAFKEEIIKGEEVTRQILSNTGKKLEYFRFPFNGTGKDSVGQANMKQFLTDRNYVSVPFTVESDDWLYTQLYEKELRGGNHQKAAAVGEQYVQITLDKFGYFDSLSVALFGRPVNQIYLCHDNRLNTDYLPVLVRKLSEKEYRFVSLADALRDPAYQSKDYYYGNAGFSWIYRWMKDPEKRRAAMKREPENVEIQRAYEQMQQKKLGRKKSMHSNACFRNVFL